MVKLIGSCKQDELEIFILHLDYYSDVSFISNFSIIRTSLHLTYIICV